MAEVLADHFEVVGSVAWVKSQWGLGWPLQRRWEMLYLVRKGRPKFPRKGDCDVWEAARDNVTDHPSPPEPRAAPAASIRVARTACCQADDLPPRAAAAGTGQRPCNGDSPEGLGRIFPKGGPRRPGVQLGRCQRGSFGVDPSGLAAFHVYTQEHPIPKFLSHARSLSLPFCAVAALAGTPGAAQASLVVVPDANATAPGGFQTPAPFRRASSTGGAGAHNQIVFDSSSFGGGPITISALSFRPLGFGSDINVTDTTIRLSTTAASENSLSSTFASNLGSDAAVVYSGALSIDSSGTPVFDVTVNLKTPFTYNPSKGNLLLDVVIPATATVTTDGLFGSYSLDDANNNGDGVGSVTNITDGNATAGTVATDAAVTQFTFTSVPEPTSLAVIGLMAAGAIARRRRAS